MDAVPFWRARHPALWVAWMMTCASGAAIVVSSLGASGQGPNDRGAAASYVSAMGYGSGRSARSAVASVYSAVAESPRTAASSPTLPPASGAGLVEEGHEPPRPAPSPAPSPEPSWDPGPVGLERARAALHDVVPPAWLDAVQVRLDHGPGGSSWADPDGTLFVGAYHLAEPWPHLRWVVAHEFGHHIAFSYGTGAYTGAPPAWFPSRGFMPEEQWADCVATAWSGYVRGAHGAPPCPESLVAEVDAWLGDMPLAPS